MNRNGETWLDDEGHLIQAHGGYILNHEGMYYWYGENKDVDNQKVGEVTSFVPFVGISCYRSMDLKSWHAMGDVLTAASDPLGRIESNNIVERPKVLYNAENNNYVMWAHYDTSDYHYAGCLVATADSPSGPFTVQKLIRPNGKESRDMTLYQDGSKTYLVHSSDMNKTLYFSELTADYQDCTGFMAKIFEDQEREAPAILHTGEWYFIITSGTTGWKPNPALFSRSKFLFSGQKLIDNPCVGIDARTTYHGQPTQVINFDRQPYLLLDHWKPQDLKHSGYSLLPIYITGERKRDIEIPWVEKPLDRLN